jgi:hypothetical protein
MNNFKNEEIWRFYIDGNRQNTPEGLALGSQVFDQKEPGYMKAMLNAHELMVATLHDPLTPRLFIDFFKTALNNVTNTENDKLETFRDDRVGAFGVVNNLDHLDNPIPRGNTSLEGIKEFLKDITENGNPLNIQFHSSFSDETGRDTHLLNNTLEIYKESGLDAAAKFLYDKIYNEMPTGGAKFYVPHMEHKQVQIKVQEYIDRYNEQVKNAPTEDAKLDAIITLVQNLVRLHPFTDGNCRTFAMLLLNRELIRNGLPPTMLDNPNRFDFFSKKELKAEIANGQKYALTYQSEIAPLPSFQALDQHIDQLHDNRSKAIKKQAIRMQNILRKAKDMPLEQMVNFLEDNIKNFNKNKGLTARILGTETKEKNLANNLINDLKEIQQKNSKANIAEKKVEKNSTTLIATRLNIDSQHLNEDKKEVAKTANNPIKIKNKDQTIINANAPKKEVKNKNKNTIPTPHL